MTDRLERLLSGALTVTAIAIAVTLVHREFFAKNAGVAQRKAEFVQDWQAMVRSSRVEGNPAARVTVVEFADFQCPFCRRYNTVLHSLMAKYPNDVRLAFVHFPLAMHEQAQAAARAAECAAAANKFDEAANLLYSKQDSLGKKSWASFAAESGVKDTVRFTRCMSDSSSVRMVAAGLALGNSIKVLGTPTVILNGWRYGGAPADTELTRAVDDILAGRKPYKGFRFAQ